MRIASTTLLGKWPNILNRFITRMNEKWNNNAFRHAMKADVRSKGFDPELLELS
jgi:hypothetical protein